MLFRLSSFILECINELSVSNKEANRKELQLHLASALCSWMCWHNSKSSPPAVTFFVIFFFFQSLYIDESNCQSILKTIQQTALNHSSFLCAVTAYCPSTSIWWSLPGIKNPAGWRGQSVCVRVYTHRHMLFKVGKLDHKLENRPIFIDVFCKQD